MGTYRLLRGGTSVETLSILRCILVQSCRRGSGASNARIRFQAFGLEQEKSIRNSETRSFSLSDWYRYTKGADILGRQEEEGTVSSTRLDATVCVTLPPLLVHAWARC